MVIAAVLSLPLSTMTRLAEWHDELALWEAAVAHSPEKPRPLVNLGDQLLRRGVTTRAEQLFRVAMLRSADRAWAEWPGQRVADHARFNLALLVAADGRYQEALALVQTITRPEQASRLHRVEQTWRRFAAHGPSLAY